MTILRADPFNLVQGDTVVAKVLAVNEIGSGEYSSVNIGGAIIEEPPKKMVTPTRGQDTSESQI